MLKHQVYQPKSNDKRHKESKDLKESREKKEESSYHVPSRKRDDSRKEREEKENRQEGWLSGVGSEGKDSRIIHNNWIINNQVMKEPHKNNKNPSSKSVIMVKPNYALQNSDQPNRGSLRKAGSERKPDKDEQPHNSTSAMS